MKTVLRNIIAVVVLIAVVYFVTNYAGQIQAQVGVKGASTSRAQEIAGKIGSDVGSQVASAEQQLLQIKVSDIINGLSRFQRIPQDATNIKSYVQDQVNNVLESRNVRGTTRNKTQN
ncbi:MAG TPA: hypothetical protein VND99_06020 [Candidatus Acidoferrales bacterium]|nr:hypothetical protein [Candidatus Acidoferrales bacterium]